MKYFLRCFCILFIGLNLLAIKGLSQNQPTDNSYYVVIGAFANPKNAIEFTERAKKKNYKAEYSLNVSRNLYYVYILNSADRMEAITLAVTQQKGSEYNDTWVYQGLLGTNPQVVKIQESERKQILGEVEEQKTLDVQLVVPKKEEAKPDDGSRKFIFRLKSLSTGENVIGDVDVFDADLAKARKAASYRGNDTVTLKPVNKSGNLAVVCDVFGYRKLQLPVNMTYPQVGDGVTIDGNVIVMTFDLVRLKTGDKVTMYNVYFFKDAAVMRPESRYEVNALVDFMKENDKARIRIHGHTNGSGHGKIISMGESKDFFGLSKDNKEGVGSAVKLSEERAKVIRSYLVNQGVEESRMEIKAWGGKQPIYDEDHTSAAANVRVEIEVLED